jgi:hypothetical protein
MQMQLELKLRFRELLADAKQCFTEAFACLTAIGLYLLFREYVFNQTVFMLLLALFYMAFLSGLRSLTEAVVLTRFSRGQEGSSHA